MSHYVAGERLKLNDLGLSYSNGAGQWRYNPPNDQVSFNLTCSTSGASAGCTPRLLEGNCRLLQPG